MPFYIADYLADTTRLTTEQHGAYFLLILDYWRNGPPPDRDSTLAQIVKLTPAKWRAMRPVIAEKFRIEEGLWKHKRVEREILKASGNVEAKQAAGIAGAAAKWGGAQDQNKMKRSERLAGARAIATHTAVEWHLLLEICGRVCCRCASVDDLVKDHITPIYQGGSDGIENLQPLCRSCNASKGPESKDLRPVDWLQRLGEALGERLPERLTDACRTPAPSPSPTPFTPTASPTPPPPAPKSEPRKRAPAKTRLSDDFSISERVRKWAERKGFDRLDDHLESFIRKCRAKGYTYVDWDEGFMGAITDDWARLRNGKTDSREATIAEAERRIFGGESERDITDESKRL